MRNGIRMAAYMATLICVGRPADCQYKPEAAGDSAPIGWLSQFYKENPGVKADFLGVYLSPSSEGKHWAISRNGARRAAQYTKDELKPVLRKFLELDPGMAVFIGSDDRVAVGVLRDTLLMLDSMGVRKVVILHVVEGVMSDFFGRIRDAHQRHAAGTPQRTPPRRE